MFRCSSVGVLVAAVTGAACVKQLPPAATPEAIAPPVDAPAPPPGGHGRLVIDVVEGPTPVQRVRMDARQRTNANGRTSYSLHEVPEVLCPTTPCGIDLPFGNVLLGFPVAGDSNDTEVELVNIGPEPSVYRRSLSIYEDNTGATRVMGIILTAVGGTAATTGAVLLPIGLAKDSTGMTTAGGISLGAGAALLTIGILMMRADAPTYRPGSSNHFPLR